MKLDTSLIGHSSTKASIDAREAESFGFKGVWATESVTDAFLQSVAIALNTETVDIGTAIAVAFARNPMSTAYAAWDIAAASQGRFTLGLGTQIEAHIVRRFAMPWGSPVERLEDYIRAIQAIFVSWRTGSRLKYEGAFYSHTLMSPVFTPPLHDYQIPIYIAAVGVRMTELAGSACDGVILHGMTHPAFLDSVTLPALHRGFASTSRTRDNFTVTCPLFMAMGENDQEIEIQRNKARDQIAFYASTPAYKGVLESLNQFDIQPQLQEMSRRGEWDQMGSLISDQLLDEIIVSGTPEQMPKLVQQRFGNRFDRVSSYFGWPIKDADRMTSIIQAFDRI